MAAAAGLLTRNVAGSLWSRGLVGCLLRPALVAANTLQPCRGMAARKGTREKARKKKVKVEVQKIAFDPLSQRSSRNRTDFKPKMVMDIWKADAIDNVYPAKFYKSLCYTFEEAIEMHRETHHPTIYNCPNSLVNLSIECDMHGEKKTKFIEKIVGNANIQHHFDQEIKRTIIMFSKNPEDVNPGLSAGAVLAGGVDLVKGLQSGDVTFRNVDYVVASQEILPELAPIRGLFKLQYPNTRHGTINDDPVGTVKRLMTGLEYSVQKDIREPEYGWCNVNIGRLNMPVEHLKANLMTLLADLKSKVPLPRQKHVIWRLKVSCAPGVEKFELDLFNLLGIKIDSPSTKVEPVKREAEDEDKADIKVASRQ